MHAEVRVDRWPSGRSHLRSIEVAARIIGGLCARTLRFGAGISLEEVVLRHALGMDLDARPRGRRGGRDDAADPAGGDARRGATASRGARRCRASSGSRSRSPSARGRPAPRGRPLPRLPVRAGRTPAAVEAALRAGAAALDIVDATLKVLLVSTYELGHPPLGVAAPAGDPAGPRSRRPRCSTSSVDDWDPALAAWADQVAISVPMHTAARLAHEPRRRCIDGADRRASASTPACAPTSPTRSSAATPSSSSCAGSRTIRGHGDRAALPARDLLPAPERYAHLEVGDDVANPSASTEASVGCCAPLPALPGARRLRRSHPHHRRRHRAGRRRRSRSRPAPAT